MVPAIQIVIICMYWITSKKDQVIIKHRKFKSNGSVNFNICFEEITTDQPTKKWTWGLTGPRSDHIYNM